MIETLQPDVVLADVVMPGPTGYEICRQVKSSDRPVPVLLLAGTFEAFDHDLARSCGADGCLMKPFESRTLMDRVSSLLADREAVTSSGVVPVTDEADEVAAEIDESPAEPTAAAAPAALDPELAADLPAGFTAETLEAIARAVVQQLSEEVVREIADEVVPRVAEEIVRRRIREIEAEDS